MNDGHLTRNRQLIKIQPTSQSIFLAKEEQMFELELSTDFHRFSKPANLPFCQVRSLSTTITLNVLQFKIVDPNWASNPLTTLYTSEAPVFGSGQLCVQPYTKRMFPLLLYQFSSKCFSIKFSNPLMVLNNANKMQTINQMKNVTCSEKKRQHTARGMLFVSTFQKAYISNRI